MELYKSASEHLRQQNAYWLERIGQSLDPVDTVEFRIRINEIGSILRALKNGDYVRVQDFLEMEMLEIRAATDELNEELDPEDNKIISIAQHVIELIRQRA